MIERNLGHIAQMIGGKLSDQSMADTSIKGVSTDSRTISPRNLYIPLIGEVFDGRIFIKECEDKGASAFLIDKDFAINKNISIPYIIVDDTQKALRDLAKAYRQELDVRVIAITGSNGKTSTKDILSSVLSEKYEVKKTIGNLNNDIGVPKTILDLSDTTEVAVIELGTDNFGDIALTSPIVKPHIATILNIGDSHLHNLKTKEGIAKAKLEIIDGLDKDGIFIYNIDDEILAKEIPNYDINHEIRTFGTKSDADFILERLESNGIGVEFKHKDEKYHLPLIGDHQIYNAGFAVMVAKILGLSDDQIRDGLSKVKTSSNRSELIELDGFDILDDSYKSNPQSLLTGLTTSYMLGGYKHKIAVLGDMLELGDGEEELHYDVGTKIDPNKIDYCLFFGPLSKKMYEGASQNFPSYRIFHFDKKGDVCDKLKQLTTRSTLIFVKGSHGMHMEEIIECIKTLKI